AYRPTIPALVQKPASKQMNDSRCRSAGVRPKSVTITVDNSNTAIVSGFTPKRCVSSPNTAPPVAPPTLAHTRTPAADEAAKPKITANFRHPLQIKVEGGVVKEVRAVSYGGGGAESRREMSAIDRWRTSAGIDGNTAAGGWPIRARARLMRSSAPAG